MTRCLSRATVITVRLDMKAATQGTVLTSLDITDFSLRKRHPTEKLRYFCFYI